MAPASFFVLHSLPFTRNSDIARLRGKNFVSATNNVFFLIPLASLTRLNNIESLEKQDGKLDQTKRDQ